MIRIRFAPGEGCDLSGTPAELRAVAQALSSLSGSVSFAADTSPPADPYPFMLSTLEVRVGSGPVCASVRDDVLCVTAASEFLAPFASCFQLEETTPGGYHVHHEYFPGNDYISSVSIPLVISVRPPYPVTQRVIAPFC